MAYNHEQLERAHSICLASHQRIIAAIEFPLAAHELLFSPHIFIWEVVFGFGSGLVYYTGLDAVSIQKAFGLYHKVTGRVVDLSVVLVIFLFCFFTFY